MTREQALEIARTNHIAHTQADINSLFKGGSAFDAQVKYGYKHGWYTVENYTFCVEEITGEKYDNMQAGWAYL